MTNDKEGLLQPFLRLLFGDKGRFVLLGVGLTILYFSAMDFKKEIREEAVRTRQSLDTYIASNQAWQNLSMLERKKLLKQANTRLRRLYESRGWDYEEIEP